MVSSKYKKSTRPPSAALAAAVKRELQERGDHAAAELLGVTRNTLARIAASLPCRSTSLEVVGRRLGITPGGVR